MKYDDDIPDLVEPELSWERLRAIANGQRILLRLFLVYLVYGLVFYTLLQAAKGNPDLQAIFGYPKPNTFVSLTLFTVGFVLALSCAVSAVVLAAKFYHAALVVFVCLGFLVPCVNLLLVAMVSSRASFVLKREGFRVGLLGMSTRDYERLVQKPRPSAAEQHLAHESRT